MTRTKFGEIIEGTNRYITWRKKEHFMVKYNGYGISLTELRRLHDADVKEIIIKYKTTRGTTKYYKSQLWDWINSTKEYNEKGDKQKFLSLNEMYYSGEGIE